jgi:hypothetical protein
MEAKKKRCLISVIQKGWGQIVGIYDWDGLRAFLTRSFLTSLEDQTPDLQIDGQ